MKLGKLEQIPVREYWKNEEYDFTPWLAKPENIQLLSEEISLDLEVEAVEMYIGSYKADIVAKESEGRRVIIENQLEKTDHKHLGQIITYASGVDASIIIWICTQVTDEHRQAIDWLNEVTNSELSFFAFEIELWRIGDSDPAPKFKNVASPNDWKKIVKNTIDEKGVGATDKAHLEFWTGFKAYMEEHGSELKLKQPRPQYWYTLPIGQSGFHIGATVNTKSRFIVCEFCIKAAQSKAFDLLKLHQEEIERKLGPLIWEDLPNAKDCKVKVQFDGDSKNPSDWEAIFAWLKKNMEAFYEVFPPLVKSLSL